MKLIITKTEDQGIDVIDADDGKIAATVACTPEFENWLRNRIEPDEPDLLEALKNLTEQVQLSKLSIRKDFSLINAHAAAVKAIAKAEGTAVSRSV